MLRRILFALVALSTPVSAQGNATDSVSRWVDSIFSPYDSRQSPGCAVGVSHNGVLDLSRTYGMADLEHDAPITINTRFYVASVSKQFTAMAIVLLARDHKLSLDDPIQKWVPEVPNFGTPITLRHLLNHTSGLRDYFTLLAVTGWPTDGHFTEQQFLTLLGRQKTLNFQPGEEFLYSNTGYVLLSIVVKRASGQSLRDFAAARIFRPLGMSQTEFRDDHNALIPQRAVGYEATGAAYRISQPEFDVVGDGGAYSTVGDLARWDANLSSGRVGGVDGVKLLQTPGKLNNGAPIPYALGLAVGDFRGIKTISHGGAYGGYRSEVLRFPDKALTMITLCNSSGASTSLAEQVAAVVLRLASATPAAATIDFSSSSSSSLLASGTLETPPDTSAARRRNDELMQLDGSYFSDELNMPVTLAAQRGIVLMQRPRSDQLRFVPVATDLFTNSDKMLLRVVRDSHGAVSGFTLTINRVRDLEFVRREPERTPH